jgi:hypothetical protein
MYAVNFDNIVYQLCPLPSPSSTIIKRVFLLIYLQLSSKSMVQITYIHQWFIGGCCLVELFHFCCITKKLKLCFNVYTGIQSKGQVKIQFQCIYSNEQV